MEKVLNTIGAVDIATVRGAVEVMRKKVPSRFCELNVAQYRALKSVYAIDKNTGAPPALNIISFANGVGKTHLLVLDMIGWTMGHEYLCWEVYPPEVIAFYASLSELRDNGMLSLRLVCAADDMKVTGSVFMILKELFPMARLAGIDQSKCYRQIEVPHPTMPEVANSISVKTFDQDKVKHSGSTCNRVWINEPLPEELVGETIGRIRSKKVGVQGSVLMCATLVNEAGWVQEFENDPAVKLNNVRGHIYENCDAVLRYHVNTVNTDTIFM